MAPAKNKTDRPRDALPTSREVGVGRRADELY